MDRERAQMVAWMSHVLCSVKGCVLNQLQVGMIENWRHHVTPQVASNSHYRIGRASRSLDRRLFSANSPIIFHARRRSRDRLALPHRQNECCSSGPLFPSPRGELSLVTWL